MDKSAVASLMLLFLGLVVLTIAALHQRDTIKQQAIEHGYAQYHPDSGDWQWIENDEHKDEAE